MKFGYTILYVPDVEAALAFYEKAFAFKRRFLDETGRYGELDTGATTLGFASESLALENAQTKITPNRADKSACAIEIAFTTDDVEGAMKRAIDAGAASV